MRTIDRLSPTAALARLRAQVDRLWRSVMVQRPAVRWGLALAAVLGVSAASYWAATSLSTTGRPLPCLRAAVFLRRPDQGLPRPRQAAQSHTGSTTNGGSKLRPISSTRLPRSSPSSTWANTRSTRSGANRASGASGRLQRAGAEEAACSREDPRAADQSSSTASCWSSGVDPSPAHVGVAARDLEAHGVRLHRDRGEPQVALSNRPVDPWDPGRLRARSDSGFDHGDGQAAATSISTPATRRSATARATGLGKRRSVKRSSRSSTGSRACGSRCR